MDRGIGGETEPEDRDGDEESTNDCRVESLGKKESVVVRCRDQRGRKGEEDGEGDARARGEPAREGRPTTS